MRAKSSASHRRRLIGAVGVLWTAAAAGACDGPQSALDPAGPAAGRIAVLWWVMFAVAAIVVVAVIGLTLYALLHRRERPESVDEAPSRVSPEADVRDTRLILLAGGGVTTLVLLGVFLVSLVTLGAIVPERGERPALVVEVTGFRWWWHVRYLDPVPSNVFATANEIRIPVGRRVEVRLRSGDVIHSFWVPSLQGKLDLVPGKRNVTWIRADEPGVWRGQCAEYCGLQHARMAFTVVAMPETAFAGWLDNQRAPAEEPRDEDARRGQTVFLNSGCALCHTIRGTPTAGIMGPDLTHLATRLTLAAGTIPNTKGHLGGWVANPQEIKPGALMPRVSLPAPDFHALLHYLTSLR